MKKLLVFLLIAAMSLSLVACGNNNDTSDDTQKDNPSTTQSSEQNNESQKEDDKGVTFTSSYKVPGKNIVIDVPDYQELEKGFTMLYILHGEKYVAITAEVNSQAKDLSDAHDIAFSFFKEAVQNYSYVNSLNIKSEKTEKINGIDVYKYEGTLNCALDYSNRDNSYEAYAIGYSFIMDGVPCTVTGSVINQSQKQETIDEMKATVEAMIKTLRSER